MCPFHVSVCSKCSQLCFCQILFELVYSWKTYLNNNKVKFLLRHSVDNSQQRTFDGHASAVFDCIFGKCFLRDCDRVDL